MPSTSGTVSTFLYTNRMIIEHAARRAGAIPQKLSAEDLQTSLESLFTITSEWTNQGFPLWTRQFGLLGCAIGSPDVNTPPGTIEVLHSYWRIFMPYRGPCTLSPSAGDNTLFGGQPNPDVTITGPNPSVTVNFTSVTEIDTVGVLLGGSTTFTAALQILGSLDNGATFQVVQTLPTATYAPGQWVYFDLNPSLTFQYLRIQYPTSGSWVLNQLNFALANGQDIENGPLSIDDYYNLPNKQFRSDRVNSIFQDRQRLTPVLKVWPVPSIGGFYNGTVSALSRRYIQDPGKLTDVLEVPQRWFEAIVWRLSSVLIFELGADAYGDQPPAIMTKNAMSTMLSGKADKSEALAWGEERNRGPIRLTPSLACYTR